MNLPVCPLVFCCLHAALLIAWASSPSPYFPHPSCPGSFVGFWKYASCWSDHCIQHLNVIPPHILENEAIRIGVDPDMGGVINYVAHPSSPHLNYINSFDLGRQIQMSFYSSPNPYNPDGACDKLFRGDWPWNPIGAGDVAGNPGEILELDSSKDTMRVLTRPMQWACQKVPCECTFEQTINAWGSENDPVVKVTATLHNARTDSFDETHVQDQELPAMYTNAILSRMVTYNGSRPFTNDTVVEYTDVGFDNSLHFPWIPGRFPATEHWAAFVNAEGWGLGMIQPTVDVFLAGFSTPTGKGCGGPRDNPTGYLAPVSRHALPANSTFQYEFYLVLGTVKQIRHHATEIMMARRVTDDNDLREQEQPRDSLEWEQKEASAVSKLQASKMQPPQ